MPDEGGFISREEASQPPGAPQAPGGPRLYGYQWVGIPLLGLIVLLALGHVFGPASAQERAQASSLSVEVQYPTRFRYKQIDRIWIRVTNLSSRMIDTVQVEVDPEYLRAFSNVSATPAFESVYRIPITHLEPGEVAEVKIGIQAERFGRHEGWIRISSPRDTARISVHTFAFP